MAEGEGQFLILFLVLGCFVFALFCSNVDVGIYHASQAGIKIARRNIKNLRYADDTTLMAEREEELKSLSVRVKEGSGKVGLKLNIQKTKIMASSTISSWQIEGEKWKE